MTTQAKRYTFLEKSLASGNIAATFRFTKPWVAIENQRSIDAVNLETNWAEPIDQLDVVFAPATELNRWNQWLSSSKEPLAVPPIEVTFAKQTIHWRPGRAVIIGEPNKSSDALAALLEFAFHEGKFRELEAALETRETTALADVSFAYRIESTEHASKFGETIEFLYSLRIKFAQVEPRLSRTPRHLSLTSRKLLARLFRRTDLEGRLEEFDVRLETCEDLYEGGSDRIADFRWYRGGHRLEIAIILLLVLEVILMSSELIFRLQEVQAE